MKSLPPAAVAAALIWVSASASAQCPSGGAPAPGVPHGDAPRKPAMDVVLKFYGKSDPEPAGLKAAIEKIKGVNSVTLIPESKTALVSFSGKCEQLGAIESAAQTAGIPALVLNHAHVVVALKPLKGADPKSAAGELAIVEGVHGVNPGPSGLELHSDLQKLSLENLKSAVARFNCEIIVNQTFEYVRYRILEGDPWAFQAAADAVKGVMLVREEADRTVGLWIHKAMVKTDQLEKIAGFKVERR